MINDDFDMNITQVHNTYAHYKPIFGRRNKLYSDSLFILIIFFVSQTFRVE